MRAGHMSGAFCNLSGDGLAQELRGQVSKRRLRQAEATKQVVAAGSEASLSAASALPTTSKNFPERKGWMTQA